MRILGKTGFPHSEETKKKIGDALRQGVYFNCDFCKKESWQSPSHYIKKSRHFCSSKCYADYRELYLLPEEQNNWKGGVAKENQRGRGGRKYKVWQQAVFKRDFYRCVWCSSRDNLEADHIKRWVKFPELRLDVDNGRTLCRDCHNTTRGQNKELLK